MESTGFYFFGVFYALHQSKIPLKEADLSWSCGVSQEKDGLPNRLGTSKGMLGDDGTRRSIVLEGNGSRWGTREMSLRPAHAGP